MIEYDENEKRMVLKLVYYGPALSGKTTNLLQLHECLIRQGRGELMLLDTTGDRTIYFDLLPFFLTAPSGLRIKVKVYTVPGQVCHDATRKAVLQRSDGVAFIADSKLSELESNFASFDNLERNLAQTGLDIETIPLVIQFNKRDLPDCLPESDIIRTWQPTGIPVLMASAIEGAGVIETFTALVGLVFDRIDQRFRLAGEHGLSKEEFVAKLTTVQDELEEPR
ncbi:GTP-binding protein [Citrifermentans bremense]|uniref:GTP-binding protein n=1 Tax=Citrifermentans bremense TaxID=60035 RepID=UPI000404706E|nr:GTPase domain-containing protein [Citrifermentans bremense]